MVMLRLLLTFSATSLLVVVYEVKSPFLFAWLDAPWRFWVGGSLVLIPIVLTLVCIRLCRGLGKDSLTAGTVVAVGHASNSFLPSYLGYFFVALSIPNPQTLGFVYAVLFAFTFVSQALYFNPLFLLFGFKFYNVTTVEGTSLFLISRQDFRSASSVDVAKAARINGYTLLEVPIGSRIRKGQTPSEAAVS